MPKLSEMFPSKYLQASDVEGQAYTLTVEQLMQEDVADGEKKWIIHFREAQKGLVLNRTNANTLEWLYGSDTDMWLGKQIVLFTEMTSYMGKPCLGIRMRGPNAPAYAQPAALAQAPLDGPAPAPAPAQPMQGAYGAPERPAPPLQGPGEKAAVQAAQTVQAPLAPPALPTDGQTAPITDQTPLAGEIKF